MKHGKKYRDAVKKVDATKAYEVAEACKLVQDIKTAKFDETVEIHVRVNLKKSQTVRDTVVLPHQFRAEKRVLVFCKPDKEKEALEAGATFAGSDVLVEKIKGGWMDFDIAVATPDMMKDVGRLGMVLGRKGLMPNPKTGTVTFDIKAAINELKKGRIEFRADKAGIVHLAIGKASMAPASLAENVQILIDEVTRKRPADAKGEFVQSIYLASTMGPSVKVALAKAER
ncbi:MAG: 50S ribosomal protein L1 [Spirochaetes bacterium GWD1_61_31]|nr:MAG: 50S ribosomal protein L1 [Spirochaetes bacterium GWB1_60_80]OHD31289.1 MAG: 50S ribosomal protein L1 [Spirochaetes bacterium GWC1_61_12]OHD39475.1 MAG: 50S ribosomal protein L1 [Spirochaetes bacterium GWD1_61_31]OHD45527.1 MAG: 50S ribosomal protein L1 [Spirochaetes bacterium GWE1_60_18]OHD58100.1 MAG: 50S ribosomal protein L1 [Spirochaetes bacterium GWF1_60_12]HAP44671.1 50S ribosomal protein L1 [Spirochaetaceae bacterium]